MIRVSDTLYAVRAIIIRGLLICALAGGAAPAVWAIELIPVVTGLSRPVAVTHAGDGSGRLFITQQTGQILIFDGVQVLPTPFLDIGSLVSCCGERGLFSVAFHPNYAANGLFYVNYTDVSGNTVVARYSVSADPNLAEASSAVALLTISQPFSNHNGGQLQFGPDGYLYIGMGDGGSAGDPLNHAQDPQSLLGKMLRIDVNQGTPYGIPPSNPFVGNGGVLDEIWALGLRNPWRFSFDRLTGDLFIGDVGQGAREEIDFQAAGSPGGENYGWRLMEGTLCYNPATGCNDGSLTLPILEYSHGLGCSVTGGFRYRGTALTQHYGTYFFGDYCSGRLWGAVEESPGNWTMTELMDTSLSISGFGEDEVGELYVIHLSDPNGAIYRIGGASAGGLVCDIQMSDDTYTSGQAVDVTSFRLANQGSAPVAVEFKVWLTTPGGSPSSVANIGSDGSFVLAAGQEYQFAPLSLGTVQTSTVRGSYEFSCRLLDPVNGALLGQDLNPFQIQ